MIDNFFTSEDPAVQADLDRIHALVRSETFLQGLGVNAHKSPSPAGFPVVTDIARASELLVPRELDALSEPQPYYALHEVVVEVKVDDYGVETSSQRERYWESRAMDEQQSHYFDTFLQEVDAVLIREKVTERFLTTGNGEALKRAEFEWFADAVLPNNIYGLIYHIVRAAYICGVDNSPVFKRLLEGFETGGVPCGWLGTHPGYGGDPVKAVALLHFGQGAQA